ncbi:MAG TPA: hypothetical protein VF611_21940 [Pyrinomonadaceae bacterium]|jgi:hypothetical protein
MKSGSNTASGLSPERAGKQQKVEVSFEQQEGGASVALRYLTWTDGLGWCCQKTIRVEEEQLDELHRAITVARHRVRRQHADAGDATPSAQVIRLPSLS